MHRLGVYALQLGRACIYSMVVGNMCVELSMALCSYIFEHVMQLQASYDRVCERGG